jgi:hypothetical protein
VRLFTRASTRVAVLPLLMLVCSSAMAADLRQQVITVGPDRAVKTIGEAAREATSGSVVEVDSGTYEDDTAVWTRDGVTVRAIGGRVRLLAAGASAEGKAIWVVRAQQMRIEGFDFEGARVPSRNGAGIRFESGSLQIRDCSFVRNEMGLLTGNDPLAVLEIEDSEFADNGRDDGHNHNLYVGSIARFSVSGSYFHHAHTGHLLKSRAAVNHVQYNRLTDEGGTASYELEFPAGGLAFVIGNLIQQSVQTENQTIISFGAEGYAWPVNELYLINNTVVDDLPRGGIFLRTYPGAGRVVARNNLWVGSGTAPSREDAELDNNFSIGRLALDAQYRLKAGSRLRGKSKDPGVARDTELRVHRQFRFPRGTSMLDRPAANPGALQ